MYDHKDFGNCHWSRGFYDKMVETFGQEMINDLENEMFAEWEVRHQANKTMLEAHGWEEIERGIYISKASPKQYEENIQRSERWKKEFREWKDSKGLK